MLLILCLNLERLGMQFKDKGKDVRSCVVGCIDVKFV